MLGSFFAPFSLFRRYVTVSAVPANTEVRRERSVTRNEMSALLEKELAELEPLARCKSSADFRNAA